MISIKNWNKFQHFKDRKPPWIKLHRDILEQRDISAISDRSFRVLVGLWLLASEDCEMNGGLPGVEDIAFRLRVDNASVINALSELEPFLILDDIKEISEGYQVDSLEKEGEVETEAEEKTELEVETMPSKLDDVKKILDHLIAVSGKGFKHVESNYTPIKARLKECHSVADIIAVIDLKDRDWPIGDPFRQYLRPETLFGAKKFNGYVGELGVETPEQANAKKLEEWASGTTPQDDVIEGEVMQ